MLNFDPFVKFTLYNIHQIIKGDIFLHLLTYLCYISYNSPILLFNLILIIGTNNKKLSFALF